MPKIKKQKDLTVHEKTVANFLLKHYKELMDKAVNTENLLKYIKTEFKKLNVSKQYTERMLEKLKRNSPTQNMFYLTNALLKGKGLGIEKF